MYIVGFLVIAISLLAAPLLNPDGLEMVQVGQCLLGINAVDYWMCETWQPLYYPPVFPILAGLFTKFFGIGAIFSLSILSAALLVRPLSRIVEGISGQQGVTGLMAITLLSISSYSFYGLLAEPRMLSVFMLFFLWSLMFKVEGYRASRQPLVLIGVLSGILMLIRPEGILASPMLVAYSLWRLGRRGWRIAVGFLMIALPWWCLLSVSAGRLTVSSRSWELAGASLLSYLPVRPLVQLWGVGASDRPMRDALSALGPSEFSGESSAIDALLSVLLDLTSSLPAPLLILAAIGLYLSIKRHDNRHLSVGMVLIVVPYLALAMTPVGRDVAMPLNNLLPVVFVVAVYGVVGLLWLSTFVRRRLSISGLSSNMLLLSIVFIGGRFTPYPSSQLFWPQSSESGYLAASWLNENISEGETVASTFASSPIVHISERPWLALPSRWDGSSWEVADRPSWLVVSAVDGPWPISSPMFGDGVNIEPRAIFSDDLGWVLVLEQTAGSRR